VPRGRGASLEPSMAELRGKSDTGIAFLKYQ
jgi:hypothetical protein